MFSPMFSTLETETNTVQSTRNWECELRRNTAAGSTSGLQIFFKRFKSTERLKNASIITGQPSVRVRKKKPSLYALCFYNKVRIIKYVNGTTIKIIKPILCVLFYRSPFCYFFWPLIYNISGLLFRSNSKYTIEVVKTKFSG